MRNIAKRITLTFMAVLVLFTSSGFGLVEHQCSVKGKKNYSFTQKNCCSKATSSSKNGINRSKCCHTKTIVQQTDAKVKAPESINQKISKALDNFVSKTTTYISQKIVKFIFSVFKRPSSSDSPPSNGLQLIIKLHKLRL
jgi:hypothetical protein